MQPTKNQNKLDNTHILKIVIRGKTFSPDVGVKCYPRQTYGVSSQSPDNFKLPNGFIAENGYLYDDEQDRINKDIYLPYFNQKKFCSVVGNTIDVVDNPREVYNQQLASNTKRFNRRKGRLSDFMQKNGWMNGVYKMMGYQRTNQARQASNRDRQKKIKSANRPQIYINPVKERISTPKQNYINSSMMTQKAKIRLERLSLHQQKKSALDIQKMMTITSKKSPQKDMYLDAEELTNKLSKTTDQKQWRSTMATIRKKHRKQVDKQDKFSLTRSDWTTNNKSIQLKPETSLTHRQQNKDEIKQWFNKTYYSGSNPWSFHKAQKMCTVSDQQVIA